jgi:hypothetical protein
VGGIKNKGENGTESSGICPRWYPGNQDPKHEKGGSNGGTNQFAKIFTWLNSKYLMAITLPPPSGTRVTSEAGLPEPP